VAKGLSPESPGRRVLLLCLLYFYYVSALSPGPKVPLNTRQTNILNRTDQLMYTLSIGDTAVLHRRQPSRGTSRVQSALAELLVLLIVAHLIK